MNFRPLAQVDPWQATINYIAIKQKLVPQVLKRDGHGRGLHDFLCAESGAAKSRQGGLLSIRLPPLYSISKSSVSLLLRLAVHLH